VSLRRSRLGKPFFAHRAVGACSSGLETEAHRFLKQMVVEVARERGWQAQTEVSGEAPCGGSWRADVLASRGAARVAVEIQWSPQTSDDTMRRQERYAASGIRCLWLFRQGSFPISDSLPAARILGNLEAGFRASLPDIFERGRQELPMREFLAAAFGKRLRFGLPLGAEATFTVRVARLPCWRCHAWTQILKEVEVTAGPHRASLPVPELGRHRGLWDRVRERLPSSFPSGTIHRRYSRTQEREYLSNGCSHCGALIGGQFGHQASDDVRAICEYTARLDEVWRAAIQHQQGSLAGWGVY
jgi:competence protein CoiA